jgi:hypothetical protein
VPLETVAYGIIRLLSGTTVTGPADPPLTILEGTVLLSPPSPNDSVPQGYYWKVTAMTSLVTGVVTPAKGPAPNVPLEVFDLDPAVTTSAVPISKTIDGKLDVNDTCQLIIDGGASIFFQWTDVPAGCRCAARFQYELVAATGAAAIRPVMY